LMDAGIEGLHTENWSDEETAFRPQITKPFPDFTELFSVSEKLGILRRARRRWGWVGVWAAWARERGVHKLLTQERILGLDLVMGVKHVARTATEGAALEAPAGRAAFEAPEGADVPSHGDQEKEEQVKEHREEEQLTGLPLFGDKSETPR